MLRFSHLRVAIAALTFSFTAYSQVSSFGLDAQVATEAEFESGPVHPRAQVIGHGDDYVWVSQVKLKTFGGERMNIFKMSISTGEEIFNVVMDDEEFRDMDLIYEDLYVYNDQVHVIYRTEKEDEDSVYLVDRMVDIDGVLHEPRVLLASWLDDEDEDDNIEFDWNEDRTSMTATAIHQDEESGNAVLVRRVFDRNLVAISTDRFDMGRPYEDFYMLETANAMGNSYLFVVIVGEERTATGVVELSDEGIRVTGAGIKHRYFRDITLHPVDGHIHLSYLSFESDRYKQLTGFNSSTIDMENGQRWVTEEDFSQVVEAQSVFASFFVQDRGRFGIKSLVPHPDGGYIATFHKTYSVTDDFNTTTYYSKDFIITYIDGDNDVRWIHYLPVVSGSINVDHMYNLATYTEGGDYVLFLSTDDEVARAWQSGDFEKKGSSGTSITAVLLSPSGDMEIDEVYRNREGVIFPSIRNLSRIGTSNEYYAYRNVGGGDSQLMRLRITGLDDDAAKVQYEVLKYGTQQ